MNRIDIKFEALKKKGEKALVGFVTAGDPDLETSLEIIKAMCQAGLDVLELGIPFSDPTADGPVIQRSSARALKSGTNLKTVLEMTKKVREITDIPIILFSYYNPILAYGTDAFTTDAVKAGADGVLIVDLPPEESEELDIQPVKDDFSIIRLIAPTTPEQRMKEISASASGFIYLVSKTGVTGSDGLVTSDSEKMVQTIQSMTNLPLCVGFGISTPEDVAAIAAFADGVVIGSAFEKLIEENITSPDLPEIMAKKVELYKNATK